jgi:hypothetical protein
MRHDGAVISRALLAWFVTFAGFFALIGFLLTVVRGFGGRRWPDRALLRATSVLAFVGATATWLVLIVAD